MNRRTFCNCFGSACIFTSGNEKCPCATFSLRLSLSTRLVHAIAVLAILQDFSGVRHGSTTGGTFSRPHDTIKATSAVRFHYLNFACCQNDCFTALYQMRHCVEYRAAAPARPGRSQRPYPALPAVFFDFRASQPASGSAARSGGPSSSVPLVEGQKCNRSPQAYWAGGGPAAASAHG